MKIIRPYKFADGGTAFSRASSARMYDHTGALVSVVNDTPRFSYDPNDLTMPPILLTESAATNLLLYSEDQSNAAWNIQAGGTVSPNSIVAPSNNTTASSFLANGSDGYIGQTAGVVSAGTTYTFSVWLKVPTGTLNTSIKVGLSGSTPQTLAVTVTASWTRFSLSMTANAANNAFVQVGGDSTLTNGETIHIWGAQLEAGATASSYIQTTSATVTRAADAVGNNLISALSENDAPVWNAASLYAFGDRVVYAHEIYQSNVGASSTVSATTSASGSPIVVNWNAHGAVLNEQFMFTAGTLPANLSLNTLYYVQSIPNANTLQLSTTVNGSAIVSTSAFGTLANITAKHSTNYNQTPGPTTSSIWLDAGPTNKYAMFDQSVESQSSNSYELNFAFPTPSTMFADSVVIQNANAQLIRVAVIDPVEGVVYDQTVNMVQDIDSADPYEYCFEPITRVTDVMFSGLPPYAGATLSISLIDPYGTPALGLCVVGQSKTFGPTQSGMTIGIQDYSLKTKDTFGYTNLEERPYAKTMTLTAFVDRVAMSNLINLLNSLRATPVVYIGDDSVTASFQYGFFKDYTMGADYVEHSTLHLEIESLT